MQQHYLFLLEILYSLNNIHYRTTNTKKSKFHFLVLQLQVWYEIITLWHEEQSELLIPFTIHLLYTESYSWHSIHFSWHLQNLQWTASAVVMGLCSDNWINWLSGSRQSLSDTESSSNSIPKWMAWGQTCTCLRLVATFDLEPWLLRALLKSVISSSGKCYIKYKIHCIALSANWVCASQMWPWTIWQKGSRANIHSTVSTTTLVKLIGTEQFNGLNCFQIHILTFFW